MKLFNAGNDPVVAVENALQTLVLSSDRSGIAMTFSKAKGFLKWRGVTFLVTLHVTLDGNVDGTALVPIRVTDNNGKYVRFSGAEKFNSWHGKPVQNLSVAFCKNQDDVTRKVLSILKIVEHHLVRKAQKKMHHARVHHQPYTMIQRPCVVIH